MPLPHKDQEPIMPPCDKPISEVSFGEAANCVWGTIKTHGPPW